MINELTPQVSVSQIILTASLTLWFFTVATPTLPSVVECYHLAPAPPGPNYSPCTNVSQSSNALMSPNPVMRFPLESLVQREKQSQRMLRLLHKFLTVFYLFQFIFIGVCLIYNAVLVSGVQQSESTVHIHIPTFLLDYFPYRSLQSIEQSSLYYPECPYQLFILYIVVCIFQCQSPNLSLPPPYLLVTIRLFSTSVTLFLFCR